MSDCSTHAFDVPLKPCPFCGGEVELTTYRDEGYIIECKNHDWPKAENFNPISDENIAGDIQLCSWGLGDEAKKALITAWNNRAERTCRSTTDDSAWCFVCSECGKSFPRSKLHLAHNHGEINYCPNCGARVVG